MTYLPPGPAPDATAAEPGRPARRSEAPPHANPQAPPHANPQANLQANPQANRPAWWALGLGIASVIPGVALAAAAVGAVGLVRARRLGGRGTVPSVIALVLAAVFLMADAGGLLAAGLVGFGDFASSSASAPQADPSPDQAPDQQSAPDTLPDPHDRDDDSLSATEQQYIDDLADVTYLNFGNSTLLRMGHLACSDFDAGRSSGENADRLGDKYGAGWGDAWDVQHAATKDFCPADAGALTADPSSGGSI